MAAKKLIRKHTSHNKTAKNKKWIIKTIPIIILFGLCIYFIVQNSDHVNLEGTWKSTKIVLNGKNLLADNIMHNFPQTKQITINNWKKTLDISIANKKIETHFSIKKSTKGIYYTILSSKEKSLNGNFVMKIDTVDNGSQTYTVYVQLKQNKTYLNFKKSVKILPWKPERPRRGQV